MWEVMNMLWDKEFGHCVKNIWRKTFQKNTWRKTNKENCISEDTEEKLWEENVLGDDTPAKLVDTLVFCFGLNFALRSGQEHRDMHPDMLQQVTPPDATAYLIYTESGSKNR